MGIDIYICFFRNYFVLLVLKIKNIYIFKCSLLSKLLFFFVIFVPSSWGLVGIVQDFKLSKYWLFIISNNTVRVTKSIVGWNREGWVSKILRNHVARFKLIPMFCKSSTPSHWKLFIPSICCVIFNPLSLVLMITIASQGSMLDIPKFIICNQFLISVMVGWIHWIKRVHFRWLSPIRLKL